MHISYLVRAQTYIFFVEGMKRAKPRDQQTVSEEAILSPHLCTLPLVSLHYPLTCISWQSVFNTKSAQCSQHGLKVSAKLPRDTVKIETSELAYC